MTPEDIAAEVAFYSRRYGVTFVSQPDPTEARKRAIADVSQHLPLSEEDCERLGIQF